MNDLSARGFDLVGQVVQYLNAYRLCYVRGPEGIIVMLAQGLPCQARHVGTSPD